MRIAARKILLSLVLFAALILPTLFGTNTYAASPDPEDNGSGISAILYDSSNGLPTSESGSIAQTPDGLIFTGGSSGLYRYDGRTFTHIDSDRRLTFVTALFADSAGRLWIGTKDNGAGVFEEGEYTFYDEKEGLPSDTVNAFAEDESGNILIATTEGIAFVSPRGKLRVLSDNEIGSSSVKELCCEGGDICGITGDGDFFLIRALAVSAFFRDEDLGFEAGCISPDPDHPGTVFIGTRGSELICAGTEDGFSEIRRYDLSPQTGINAVKKTGSCLWVCADNGIGYLNTDTGLYRTEAVPMDNSVCRMMEDADGNLWFTSPRQGLLKMVRSRFIDISRKAGLETGVVNSTYLSGGLLYVGTDTGLIVLNRDYAVQKNELTEYLEGCRIRSVKEDAEGNLYFATFSDKGLVIAKKDGTIESLNADNGLLPGNRVRTALALQNGDMLISVNGSVCRIHDGTIRKVYDVQEDPADTEILTMSEDRSGKLIFGTDGGGLYLVDENDVIRHFTKADGLTSEVIRSVKYDAQQDVHWIVSGNSIGYLDVNREELTVIDQFPYSNNLDIFPDRNGCFWVLSADGIYVVSVSDMLANTEDMSYIFFNPDRGMPAITTANSRNFLAEDGTLYISGSTGVFAINVDRAFSGMELPRIAILSLEVNGEEIWVGDKKDFTIPANTKRLTINACAPYYGLDDPVVSYRLQGFDEKESTGNVSTLDTIRYYDLDDGNYVFSFSVLDPLTGAKAESREFTITKKRGVLEKEFFWIIIVLVIGGLVFLLTRLSDRRETRALIREAEEERRKTDEKRELINQIVTAFAKCIDSKDRYTNGHSFRVAAYTKMIAERMGRFTEEEIENYYNIGLLHDIGKISIPDAVLNKPEALNDEEFEIMKSHAARGFDILSEIKIMPDLALGAGYHHEYLDGKGYPKGLSGEDSIPLVAQIIAVADAFDAMNTDRVYRAALPKDVILEELRRSRGVRLNAGIVDVFLELLDEGKIGFKNMGA